MKQHHSSTNTNISKNHRAALIYAQSFGWHVFPCKGKVPITSCGQMDATTDLAQINRWWNQSPDANIAIATGMRSKIVVLDIDAKPDALQALADLESEFGKLPETPCSLTGGGGFHFFFRHHERLPNRVAMRPGCDFKADGGYIIAPPSTHSSGKTYEWDTCFHPTEFQIADLPDWLGSFVKSGIDLSKARPSNYWDQMLRDGIGDGRRNQCLAEIVGHLLRRYVDPKLTLSLALSLNKTHFAPSLSESEVVRTVDSIAKREIARRLKRAA